MLYIEIETERLTFFSLNGESLQQTRYRMQPTLSFARNLRQALSTMPQDASTQQVVRVIVSEQGVAMPLAEFSEEVCKSVYQHCFEDRMHYKVFYDMIPAANAVWIYGMPEEHCHAIEELFGDVLYVSAMAPLGRYALSQAGQEPAMQLINCRPEWADIVMVQNGRLQLINSFRVQTPEDVAYYAMSIIQRLNTTQEPVRILLTGQVEQAGDVEREVQRFVNNTHYEPDTIRQLLAYFG